LIHFYERYSYANTLTKTPSAARIRYLAGSTEEVDLGNALIADRLLAEGIGARRLERGKTSL
jgi:hypothetical protein